MQTSDCRFKDFAARKEAEALAARLEPWTTVVDRHTPDQLAIGNAWSRARFDGDFYLSPQPTRDVPATSLVFVQSRDGNTGSKNPSSLGGGELDKHVIYEGLSRVAADAVLCGAETLRGGDIGLSVWHPELVVLRRVLGLARHPIQIVATLRGLPLDDGLMFNVPDLRVVILTVPGAVGVMQPALRTRPWIEMVVMKDRLDLAAAFRTLRTMGISRISAIGGRTIAAALADAGLVQDLYLSTSPTSAGEPNTPLSPRLLAGALVVRKRGTGGDDGVVFEQRRVQI